MVIEWRDIEDFPGYRVNNIGDVVSFKRKNPIMLKPDTDKDGYRRVYLSKNKIVKCCLVHRLVLTAFKGKPSSETMVARHLDDCPGNNNIDNLAWGTCLDNVRDRDDHQRTCKGSKQHLSKLREEDIPIIRKMVGEGKSDFAISKLYNVTLGTIWFVRRGITWKHVGAVNVMGR
ncbi:MAG: HNH endonuclease [Syntrophorhabdaceae bacterium]